MISKRGPMLVLMVNSQASTRHVFCLALSFRAWEDGCQYIKLTGTDSRRSGRIILRDLFRPDLKRHSEHRVVKKHGQDAYNHERFSRSREQIHRYWDVEEKCGPESRCVAQTPQ